MKIKDTSAKTALLIFAQSKNAESISKSIAHKKSKNVLLWGRMNERILKTVQKTNFPYFIYDEYNQIGNTFGEKITKAVREVFNKGFENVIVVGNDCLELQASHLLKANLDLRENDAVFGADSHGGAYLLGFKRTTFISDKFTVISWQTPKVFDQLIKLFDKCKIAFLPKLNDCNNVTDFKKQVLKLTFSDCLKFLLNSILNDPFFINEATNVLVSRKFNASNFNKGSPFLI